MNAIDILIENLPKKPYATDEKGFLKIVSKETAQKKKYFQHNGPTHKRWLVFDIDRSTSAFDFQDLNAPTPNIVSTNRQNGHSHLYYLLKVPVRTAFDGKTKPIKYAAAVERGLTKLLDADLGYSGLISKNPSNPFWSTMAWHVEPYDLSELADYVDTSIPASNRDVYGLGRNCQIFEAVRYLAYAYARGNGHDIEGYVYSACCEVNEQFGEAGLHFKELDHISNSISKFASRNFSAEEFSEIQAARGQLGGRPTNSRSLEATKPWEALGISRRTYFRRKARGVL